MDARVSGNLAGARPRDAVCPPRSGVAEAADWFGLCPDDLPDGLVTADEHGRVTCVNAAAERILGIRAATALGRHIADALPLQDLEGHHWWQYTDPYGGLTIRTGTPEARLLLPDGREVLVTSRYVRDETPARAVRRLVVSIRDTGMRARAEREHADLIATVAHELRSPLTSVKGFTATLLAKWSRFTDEQKRLMLETVDADADRVTRLIAELLDIARIDSGRLELRRAMVDVGAMVGDYVEALRTSDTAAKLAVATDPEVPLAHADPDKLRQVVANLLENAMRHGDGTVAITVESTTESWARPQNSTVATDAQTYVVVTVDDEGAGIPDELVGRVFTRFWRGNRRGGTGLGLYIVKGIVEAHGGTISVGRSPSGGARFRFTVPAARDV